MSEDRAGPVLGITVGDPLGIGPEIVVKSLADPQVREWGAYRVFGSRAILEQAARDAGVGPRWLGAGVEVVDAPAYDVSVPGVRGATAEGGAASMACLEDAVREARAGMIDALVTAPISKTAWNLAGITAWPGHTEFLAERFGAKRSAMLFVGEKLRVILVTIHIPLSDVPRAITKGGVLDAIELGARACALLGAGGGRDKAVRVGVCGVNPHAGEGGLLGSEDGAVIAPAVRTAQERGFTVAGPLPADALFVHAAAGRYDLVVAMYHDQGLAPVKVLEREATVNVTVGLPGRIPGRDAVRTSPAHGTAFDIAGRGVASEASMRSALRLAARMWRGSMTGG